MQKGFDDIKAICLKNDKVDKLSKCMDLGIKTLNSIKTENANILSETRNAHTDVKNLVDTNKEILQIYSNSGSTSTRAPMDLVIKSLNGIKTENANILLKTQNVHTDVRNLVDINKEILQTYSNYGSTTTHAPKTDCGDYFRNSQAELLRKYEALEAEIVSLKDELSKISQQYISRATYSNHPNTLPVSSTDITVAVPSVSTLNNNQEQNVTKVSKTNIISAIVQSPKVSLFVSKLAPNTTKDDLLEFLMSSFGENIDFNSPQLQVR